MKKIHLGCGDVKLSNWINIDFNQTKSTDLVEDVSTLPSFSEESVDEIYACHVLEHFGLPENFEIKPFNKVLKRWFDLLKPRGILYVSVPNLEAVLKGIVNSRNNISNSYDFLRSLFGGQNYKGNIHYCGFTEEYLSYHLKQTGFKNIEPFNSFSEDTSRFVLHGVKISLNLKAVKL
jgi:predicted SAM-dependent methyltransferase